MVTQGVDYSFGRPSPTCLAAGYDFVFRYVGRDPRGGKDITKAEADQLIAAGLTIAVVYQPKAAYLPQGFEAGRAAATQGHTDAQRAGMPPSRPLYLSVDRDPASFSPGNWAELDAYFQGASAVLGVGRVGVYGARSVIDRLLTRRFATYGWQTRAWSGGVWSTRAHVRQHTFNVDRCGGLVDINDAMVADFGQWPGVTGGDELTAADKKWVYDSIVDVMRKEGISGAGQAARSAAIQVAGLEGATVDRQVLADALLGSADVDAIVEAIAAQGPETVAEVVAAIGDKLAE